MKPKIEMRSREAAVIRFIRESPSQGATVRETWEALQAPDRLGDDITVQAYHRIMNKMVARGKLMEADGLDGASRRYVVADSLTPENALSLTDIEEGLWVLAAPEALARYLDALDYFEGRQKEVFEQAASGLREEDPVELVLEMFRDKTERLLESVADYADPQTRDRGVEQEIAARHEELVTLVHRYYGISSLILDLGDVDRVKSGEHVIDPDWKDVRQALQERVFGERALYFLDVEPSDSSSSRKKLAVSGSDGSTHTSIVREIPGAEFVVDEDHLLLTFNNSIVAVDLPEPLASEFDFPYHGVPMTRAALEDPTNRGMILARPWHPNLTGSEYEHMKKSALDVVQFRVDEREWHEVKL